MSRAVLIIAAALYIALSALALFILCDIARTFDGSRALAFAAVALAFASTAAAFWVLFVRRPID